MYMVLNNEAPENKLRHTIPNLETISLVCLSQG